MDATTQARIRWFHLTPGRFVLFLLAVEVLLWLSERFGWFGWHKGYAVLVCVAMVGVAMLFMPIWFAVALACHWQFQFGIRSLLVLVVAVAVPSSWLAVEMRAAKKQKEAVERIGGVVFFDYEEDASGFITKGPQPSGPAWLRNRLSDDFFARAVCVQAFDDNDLEHIHDLPFVHTLLVACDRVTGTGLQHLNGFEHITTLCVNGTTDSQLEQLAGLTSLRELEIDNSPVVTDAGVARLQNALPNCKITR